MSTPLLRPGGEVECWGGDYRQAWQSKVVPPREGLVFVDAGWGGHAISISPEKYSYEMMEMNYLQNPWRDWGYSCGLRGNGSPLCWGEGDPFFSLRSREMRELHPILFPPEGEFLSVDVGERQACGLRPGGSVECWGLVFALSGDESDPDRREWLPGSYVYNEDPVVGEGFVDVEMGVGYACGLRSGGSVECWSSSRTWLNYLLEGSYVYISSGYRHACGLREDGTVDCWASNGGIERTPESES